MYNDPRKLNKKETWFAIIIMVIIVAVFVKVIEYFGFVHH
jgi:hypothetical protein